MSDICLYRCRPIEKLLRCMGHKDKFCLSCGIAGKPDDMNNFVHCANYGCKGGYFDKISVQYSTVQCNTMNLFFIDLFSISLVLTSLVFIRKCLNDY